VSQVRALAAALLLISIGIASAHAQHRASTTLEDRVATYTKRLNLDGKQQAQFRALLLQQREQVLKVWNDTSIPAAQRIHATRAIGDATADGIRAMLTEEQREKYKPPRPQHDSAAQPGERKVEDWMNAASAR
jgi:hypothetical protein